MVKSQMGEASTLFSQTELPSVEMVKFQMGQKAEDPSWYSDPV